MSFFENIARLLQTPDTLQTHSGNTHPKAVAFVGSLLDVPEYQVFQIAWREWFGVRACDGEIEKIYDRYISEQVMPHWVRHFCHKIQELHRSGDLEPREFTGHPDRRPGMSKNILLA